MAKTRTPKTEKKQTRPSRTAITIGEAIGVFERAFWARNPNEIEEHLREMLNVQVAVVESKETAERELASGKRLKTVTVPFGVFLGKVRELLKDSQEEDSGIYRLEPNNIIGADEQNKVLSSIGSSDGILPGETYALLSKLAGYSADKGLTFSGEGDTTGFEVQPEQETREKFGEGHFQTWKEHAEGVWNSSERLAELYRPFVETWAKKTFAPQWESSSNAKFENFVKATLWAMKVAVLFHDIGKLNKKWQEVIQQNEERIRGEQLKRENEGMFIARTSPIPHEAVHEKLKTPPPHAPFAYPFLRKILRNLLGDYRFLDAIALATARHHSLEVRGGVRGGKFELEVGAKGFLENWLPQFLKVEDAQEQQHLLNTLGEAIKSAESGSESDEPPSPSDDFYFLYCLTNRMVKLCDWEDAGDKIIELPKLERNDVSA